MRTSVLFSSALAVLAHTAAAVTGAADGFAKGVTGGGNASPVYPKTTAELVSYLGDSQNRVIMLDRTFDFTGSEGTATETGCAPWYVQTHAVSFIFWVVSGVVVPPRDSGFAPE